MVALTALAARPLTRLAPSPTGELHLGHLLHLIWVVGLTRLAQGRLLLRIEDHDRPRCRPEFERAIGATLAGLGIACDLGFAGGRPDAYRQSDTPERYAAALAALRAQGRLYACACSRAEIRRRLEAQGHRLEPDAELLYDGYCRMRALAEGPDVGLRVRLDDAPVEFTDLLRGRQRQVGGGDLLVRDRTGLYTYSLCVVADDLVQHIDWVIRGEDLLSATARQLQLRRLLAGHIGESRGGGELHFAHHPLLRDEGGRKLSKRDGDASVAERLARGERPEQLFGEAAWRGGLLGQPQPIGVEEFAALVAAYTP